MDDELGADVRVLHVDDEPSPTDLVSICLEREAGDVDLSISTSNSGADALERLRQERVNCVVSDYDMPDIDGLEFLHTVRLEHPGLPFILFISKGSEEAACDAFRVSATDYMQKDTGTDQYTVLANRVVNTVSQYRAKAASGRYGTAIEVPDSGVYSLDSAGHFTSADGVFCELTGYDREAIIGREFAGLAAEAADEILSAFEQVVSPNAPDTEHFGTVLSPGPAYPHDDDLLCEGHLALRPIEGDESAVIGALQDVAERRRRRDQLRYETRLKDVVLDTSTSLMSTETDEIGTKIEWTLQPVGEVADLDCCSVYLHDDETTVAARMHDWRGGGRREHLERAALEDARQLLERLHQFENVRLHRVSDLPPETSDTKRVLTDAETGGFVAVSMVSKWTLVGFVAFDAVETNHSWTDTEADLLRSVGNNVAHTLARQRRERELQRQNDRLEKFASIVSHDLRSPLNVAKGFVEFAREEDNVTYLDHVLDGVTRMDTILNDVLTLARQGCKVGETRSVAIESVAERAWKAIDTGDDAVLVVEDELGTMQVDQGRFQQVFKNLFWNAVEHGGSCCDSGDGAAADDAPANETTSAKSPPTDATDELTVRVGPTETGFYVADNSPGIPADERDTAFEYGHTTSDSGTGLGLSIIESIIEAYGWDIEATAPEADLGSARFEFDIGGVRSEVEPWFSLSDD